MRLFAAILLLALLSCTPSRATRVDVRVRNTSPYPIRLRVAGGSFSREIPLAPGGEFDGWLDSRWVRGQTVEVIVE